MTQANAGTVEIPKANGRISIALNIGQAQWARYALYLYDKDGNYVSEIGRGLNNDNIPDLHEIRKNMSTLNGFYVYWDVGIKPLSLQKGQRYFLEVQILQQKAVIHSFDYSGALPSSGERIEDCIKIEVK
jgi:hypothetical protein